MITHDEAQELLQVMMRRATGEHEDGDEARYAALRSHVWSAPELSRMTPQLVAKCRDLAHVWEEIKPMYPTYAERRRYLRDSFTALLDHLDVKPGAGVDELPEHVRRDIFDDFREDCWSGRLDEVTFLRRLYPLDTLPSTDSRFRAAAGDIHQHRVNNADWEQDWVFSDERFQLIAGPADACLRFLAEMINPAVRSDADECEKIRARLNARLEPAGWTLAEVKQSAGRPVYAAVRVGQSRQNAKRIRERFDTAYVHRQVRRMELAAENDPDLAIGTAKELIETCCKSILAARGVDVPTKADVPELVKMTTNALRLVPNDIADTKKGVEPIRRVLYGLGSIAHNMAEIRNLYGSGHGREAKATTLQPRHARLAVGAASTLAAFLVDVHELRDREDSAAQEGK